MPERTRNVPRIASTPVARASEAFQTFSIPRFSWIISEWMNAVPVSHGSSDAFSTGSQAQEPPQPSSEYDQRAPRMIPTPRKNQAASAKRRVAEIHSASTRRTTSAPTANAKGTANSVYPEYSIGGWIIMLGWRSSAFSPMPSCGGFGSSVNGLAAKTSSPPKNAPKPSSTAVAYGATSRSCRRVRKRTRLDQSDSSQSQSSSEPCCDDHAAAIR